MTQLNAVWYLLFLTQYVVEKRQTNPSVLAPIAGAGFFVGLEVLTLVL
jgi:hypothetical protein